MSTPPPRLDLPEWIESNRVSLRAPQPGDGQLVNQSVLETWDTLHEWLPWAEVKPSIEESEEAVKRMASAFLARSDLPMLMFLPDRRTFVGGTGLHRMDWSVPRFEIGYWVRASLEGKGYVSEAVRTLTEFAFESLSAVRVEIHCSALNERSSRVATRCGYALEGRLRNHRRHSSGAVTDTLIFARVPGDQRG